MTDSPIAVLLVATDDRGRLDADRLEAESERLSVAVETSLSGAKSAFSKSVDCVVVGDVDVDWPTLFGYVRERAPDTPCLLFTGTPVGEIEWGDEPLVAEFLSRAWDDAYERLAGRIEAAVDAGGHRSYPVPPDEPDRAAAVDRYDVDALREWDILDVLTGLAASAFDVSVAILGLVDSHTYRTISCNESIPDGWPRQEAGCVFTVLDGSFCEIPDLADDPRYWSGIAVREFGMRSYSGAPLLTGDDQPIGTFCVMDTEPKSLDEEERRHLEGFADVAATLLELHREVGADAESDLESAPVFDRAGVDRSEPEAGETD